MSYENNDDKRRKKISNTNEMCKKNMKIPSLNRLRVGKKNKKEENRIE